jgi:hypothetical protein
VWSSDGSLGTTEECPAQGREYLLSGQNLHAVPNVWTSRQECEWTSQQKYSLSLPWSPCCLPTWYAGPAALLGERVPSPRSNRAQSRAMSAHTHICPTEEGGGGQISLLGMAQDTYPKYGGIAVDFGGMGPLFLRSLEPPSRNSGGCPKGSPSWPAARVPAQAQRTPFGKF